MQTIRGRDTETYQASTESPQALVCSVNDFIGTRWHPQTHMLISYSNHANFMYKLCIKIFIVLKFVASNFRGCAFTTILTQKNLPLHFYVYGM